MRKIAFVLFFITGLTGFLKDESAPVNGNVRGVYNETRKVEKSETIFKQEAIHIVLQEEIQKGYEKEAERFSEGNWIITFHHKRDHTDMMIYTIDAKTGSIEDVTAINT